MPLRNRYIGAVLSSLFFAASFLFFAVGYGAHICYQEQYQFFEWTAGYFADTVALPGGFADWTGRFLTQLFFNRWVGAAVVALLLTAVQLLCHALTVRKNPVTSVCSFIPSLFLLLYFLDSASLAGAAVAVILVLACALMLRAANASTGRTAAMILITPLLYLLAGPAAIVFVFALPKDEPLMVRATAFLLVLAMPFMMLPLCHYPLRRLMTGIHYSRIPQNIPAFLWLSIAAAVVFLILGQLSVSPRNSGKSLLPASVLALALALGTVMMVRKNADRAGEELMAYDRMVYLQDWDGIIAKASMKVPDKPLSVSALNLALAMKGMLGDSQFGYFQSGGAGLFPAYSISYFSLLTTSEVYWQLGMVGACQQYTFESQEAIPDFQKSARCYKRLAEAYIVNHDYDVAGKYLGALCNTMHYRRWARELMSLLEDEDAVEARYGRFRENRAIDPDVLFNESNKAAMLKMLLDRNPENTLAQDYLISLMLLEKDLDGAEVQIMASGLGTLPRYWQEALLMQCVSHGRSFDTLPGTVEEANVSRMRDFIGAMQGKRNKVYMKNHFGDTYWYYCIYE